MYPTKATAHPVSVRARKIIDPLFCFFHPIKYIRPSFLSPSCSRSSDLGSDGRLFSPPPPLRFVRASHFHREKTSALLYFPSSTRGQLSRTCVHHMRAFVFTCRENRSSPTPGCPLVSRSWGRGRSENRKNKIKKNERMDGDKN